jgi:hypothetical protein
MAACRTSAAGGRKVPTGTGVTAAFPAGGFAAAGLGVGAAMVTWGLVPAGWAAGLGGGGFHGSLVG